MSKPFDYSKWDKIELSDDEEDVHPNIDRESWFRMKHRSRVEREEHEEKDKKRILEEMEKANQRIKMLERDLKKIEQRKQQDADSDDEDDDDIDDTEGIKIELEELQAANRARQTKLEDYEKNKKWNVDNMFQVKEERTMINPNGPAANYTPTGFAKSTVTGQLPKELKMKEEEANKAEAEASSKSASTTTATSKPAGAAAAATTKPVAGPAKPPAKKTAPKSSTPTAPPTKQDMDNAFVYSYHEFTQRYADLVEEFMAIPSFDESKEFLLKNGSILLQENASNYLLLASLEDEMNGYRDKMKQVAKQSQIISNIAELAKSMNTHPGNVILPFFQKLQQREFLEGFLQGVDAFVQKIISRAVVKKKEMDREREQQQRSGSAVTAEGVDLASVPKDERLGPGGLDPLEVIETLPVEMQEAFESRSVDKLKQVLMKMDPNDAEYHMKRCVDSGLWTTPS